MLKTRELTGYLEGRRTKVDYNSPSKTFRRIDDAELREKILAISYKEWAEMGYGKNGLYYLKKNVIDNKSFIIKQGMRDRINMLIS